MFITPAFADTAANAATTAADASGGFAAYSQLVPMVLVFIVAYVMFVMPQNKRAQQHRDMVAALQKGDTVVTGGGLIGKIKKVDEQEVVLELSEGVQVTALRSTIVSKRA